MASALAVAALASHSTRPPPRGRGFFPPDSVSQKAFFADNFHVDERTMHTRRQEFFAQARERRRGGASEIPQVKLTEAGSWIAAP
jgi:hypothetical protein